MMPDAAGSRARAEALANKLLGESGATSATDTIVANARMGLRDADGNVVESDESSTFKGGKTKPVAKAQREPEPDDEEEADDFETDDESEEEGGDEEPDEQSEGGESEQSDADEAEFEELEYDDSDEFDVVVDGQTHSVSLRELKAKYSLQTASEQRLQEATETRKAAQAERAQFLQEAETYRSNLVSTLQQLDNVLFVPLVQPPDPALRTTNVNRYLQLKDYYEEDQKRINEARGQLAKFFDQQKEEQQKQLDTHRQQQSAMLLEKMPELRDPAKGQKVQKDILDAAAYYGFTPEQVAQVSHHALFLMARDAARWLNLQKLQKNGGKELSTSGGGRRRKLRSGTSVSVKKAEAVKNSKQQQALEKNARATGRESDVASFLASKAKTRSNKLGRFS